MNEKQTNKNITILSKREYMEIEDLVYDHKKHLNNLLNMFEFTEVFKKNYIYENGMNLSGGQRQILGFIRALYNNFLLKDFSLNSNSEFELI